MVDFERRIERLERHFSATCICRSRSSFLLVPAGDPRGAEWQVCPDHPHVMPIIVPVFPDEWSRFR